MSLTTAHWRGAAQHKRWPSSQRTLAALGNFYLFCAACWIGFAAIPGRSFCSWASQRTRDVPRLLVLRGHTGNAHRRHTARTGGAALSAAAGPEQWAAQWVDAEVAKHSVILFTAAEGVAATASRDARTALRSAGVVFEAVDIDLIAFGSMPEVSWPALIVQHLDHLMEQAGSQKSSVSQSTLPLLFAGGDVIGSIDVIQELSEAGMLQDLCYGSGAQLLADESSADGRANLTWTPRRGLRWLPPKNLNGRRWYQDEAGMAFTEDEHAHEARIEYNVNAVSPGAGTDHRGSHTGAGLMLLRQDTNLDKPDINGRVHQYPPFSKVNLIQRPDLRLHAEFATREVAKSNGVTPEIADLIGLPQDELKWLYSLGTYGLKEELLKRQCFHEVRTSMDPQMLRDALLEELLKEKKYSPTRSVSAGTTSVLSGKKLREELTADTDVPLLLAITSRRSTPCAAFRDNLQAVAKRLIRAMRVVEIDGGEYPSIAKDFKIVRYPTLIWFQGRTGVELVRRVGVLSPLELNEQSQTVLRQKVLPATEVKAALNAPGVELRIR